MTDRITLSCHCGGTKLEVPYAPKTLTQCTCTYCTKTGGLWAYYDPDELRVVSESHGVVYTPVTPLHEHHVCARCGNTAYNISPDYSLDDNEVPDRKKVAVNAKLLDDYALLVSLPVETIDGRNLW